MLLPLLTVFDLSTVRANFIKPIDLSQVPYRQDDYALLVPIFNDLKYLTNINFLKTVSEHVVLCTTTNETPEFMHDLQNLADAYGFRLHTCDVGTGVKNPWAIYNKTLLAHDAVLKSTIGKLTEKYVIFIDGDTYVDGDLGILCGAMEAHQFDIASVKVLPSRRETPMEHLQGVEYDIAMQARLVYPWLTSGAGMVAKREVMISIMKNHSLFFNGGDVEIGRLADMMGYKVGHLPMVFYTDVPPTFKGWVKQRFSWMCGMFRHSIINLDHNLKHPFHFIYYTFIIYFLIPFKIYEMITKPLLLLMILGIYIFITIFANWKVRNRWMLIFPLYALFQIIVIIWFGIFKYLKTVRISGNVGKIKMRHNPNDITIFHFPHFRKTVQNYAIISAVIFTISILNVGLFQTFILGRTYEPVELAQVVAIDINKQVQSLGSSVDNFNNENSGQVAGAHDEKTDISNESIEE